MNTVKEKDKLGETCNMQEETRNTQCYLRDLDTCKKINEKTRLEFIIIIIMLTKG